MSTAKEAIEPASERGPRSTAVGHAEQARTVERKKELEEFTVAAAHDLKAPLRAIGNAARWLEEDLGDKLTGEARTTLTLMRGRIGRMQKLLDDLLEFARIDQPRGTPGPLEMVAGDALVADVEGLVAPPPGFRIEAAPGLAAMKLQRTPLQRVLINLVGNAVKHHHRSQGTVTVSAEEGPDRYVFSVRDDGPGIAPAHHARIFEMFETVRPRDEIEGSGMGLAIVRRYVEAQGGTIGVISDEGRGSTFRFTWPKQPSASGGGRRPQVAP